MQYSFLDFQSLESRQCLGEDGLQGGSRKNYLRSAQEAPEFLNRQNLIRKTMTTIRERICKIILTLWHPSDGPSSSFERSEMHIVRFASPAIFSRRNEFRVQPVQEHFRGELRDSLTPSPPDDRTAANHWPGSIKIILVHKEKQFPGKC